MASPAYRDPRLPDDERARDLVERMTLEEKLAQIAGVWVHSLLEDGRLAEAKAREILAHGTGHVTRISGAGLQGPLESARLANDIQRFLVEQTRLGIPAIVHEEALAGFLARGATCFPQAIGLASTWDPEGIESLAGAVRHQMRAVGAHQALAPVLDLARDPRWGRTEETYGEDPYLASRIGVAFVRGLQGADLRRGVAATGKHFLGYGASEGGLNWAPVHLSARELREVYATPFGAAVAEAGLASVMNAYHEIDGVPCGASRELLDDLLRGELGFEGVVVADYFAVQTLRTYHAIAASRGEAARRALEAGIDVELPARSCYAEPLAEAIAAGRVDVARVDRAVERGLRLKLALGLFEEPYVDADSAPVVFDTGAQRALARRLARESMVLLKNEGGLLPLDPRAGSIAVVGPCADSPRLLQGDYHYPAHVEASFGAMREDGRPGSVPEAGTDTGLAPGLERERVDLAEYFVRMVTPLEGIRERVGEAVEVRHLPGCAVVGAEPAALRAEDLEGAAAAVVCVGGRSGLVEGCTSGEACDRADLGLPGAQQALVEAVVATGTPTVVVLINGRPLALPWIAEHVPAVIEAWLPGEEAGSALAEVLFGDAEPGGRLPVSLPRHVGQVPVYYGHKPSGGRSQWRGDYVDLPTQPLFAFGHGLGYTRFEYSALGVSASTAGAGDAVTLSCDVANTGDRAGTEVVQLYVRDRVASVTRPVKELKGFARVRLEPGKTARTSFELPVAQLAFLDLDRRLVVEPGTVDVMIGSSSADIRLTGAFEIAGPTTEVPRSASLAPTRVAIRT